MDWLKLSLWEYKLAGISRWLQKISRAIFWRELQVPSITSKTWRSWGRTLEVGGGMPEALGRALPKHLQEGCPFPSKDIKTQPIMCSICLSQVIPGTLFISVFSVISEDNSNLSPFSATLCPSTVPLKFSKHPLIPNLILECSLYCIPLIYSYSSLLNLSLVRVPDSWKSFQWELLFSLDSEVEWGSCSPFSILAFFFPFSTPGKQLIL